MGGGGGGKKKRTCWRNRRTKTMGFFLKKKNVWLEISTLVGKYDTIPTIATKIKTTATIMKFLLFIFLPALFTI